MIMMGFSEAYRQAHARDGINEMHPDILNRRISSQEAGELDASRVRHWMAQQCKYGAVRYGTIGRRDETRGEKKIGVGLGRYGRAIAERNCGRQMKMQGPIDWEKRHNSFTQPLSQLPVCRCPLYSPLPAPPIQESILSMPSTSSITPKSDNGELASPSFSTLEGLLFGADGMTMMSKKKSSTAPTPLFRQGEGGDDDDASPAPASRGVRRQFSLDLTAGSPSPSPRR